MTGMADGVYVVSDTLKELLSTFREVLKRARQAGLTFKPKKIIIAPLNTVLFGWKKIKDGWRPIDHTISPLTKASEPSTVKQLRSFIGSYKQISECIPNYAVLLGPLERAVAGLDSSAKIQWTDALSKQFATLKEALLDINTIFVPRPSDYLEIYSDYSQEHKVVGGRMLIKRKDENSDSILVLNYGR